MGITFQLLLLLDEADSQSIRTDNVSRRNPFVETSLSYALSYCGYVADSKAFGSLRITILADDDYYSETAFSKRQQQSSKRGRFVNFRVPLHQAHKTGLGSSAALVTALVSTVVIHRTMHPDDLGLARDKLHNLAQAAHCAAQGKVGSGFDVAAAVYGSCLYRRFSPTVLESIGELGSAGFEERLFAVVEDISPEHPWDTECLDFGMQLPRGMQMVLCDVECGSQTPSMVKQVLRWRRENQKVADAMWDTLEGINEGLRQELKKLAEQQDGDDLDEDVDVDEEMPPQDYSNVRRYIEDARDLIRIMSRKSQVPIEPKVQTELLDSVSAIDGVIGGVVPGAGGYDAIALLIQDDPAVIDRLNSLFDGYKSSMVDDPAGGKIGRVRLLGVRHGSDGMRNEAPEQYLYWL